MSKLYHPPLECSGRVKTDKEDEVGELYATVDIHGRTWAVVVWKGDYEPSLYKAELLMVATTVWKDLEDQL